MLKKLLTLLVLGLIPAGVFAADNADLAPDRSHCLGDPDAPIVLEIFSDFQCPACKQFYLGTILPLMNEYVTAGTVCVIYRDFPLSSHPYSRQAATYAVAAARTGQWGQVTGALYVFQEEWSKDGNIDGVLGRQLPARTMAQVRRLLKDDGVNASIDRDVERARKLGVRSTPTSFLTANGQTQRISGVVQYAILKRYIDHLLGR